jgi:hypothetical protein
MFTSLREAYPGAADAVEFHESDIRAEQCFEKARLRNISPEELLARMKMVADQILDGPPESLIGQKLVIARLQMDHPDFMRYLAAKLGLM